MFLLTQIIYNKMKNIIFVVFTVLAFGFTSKAQNAEKSTSIASSLGLFVFPSKNQDAATQDADEVACFKWAKEQTGFDPMNPTKVVAAQVDQSPDGTAVVGAAGGAAAGAAIGAIAGDAGEGAAIGAIVGSLRGRRASVARKHEQQAANNKTAAAREEALMGNYKKAFSACMEGKGYTVK